MKIEKSTRIEYATLEIHRTVKEWKEELTKYPDHASLEFDAGHNNINVSVNWKRDETDEEFNERVAEYNRRMIADKQRKQIRKNPN